MKILNGKKNPRDELNIIVFLIFKHLPTERPSTVVSMSGNLCCYL